jgi:hypothetical protein
LKINVEKWEGYPPEEIKESHLYQDKPEAKYPKAIFGEYIVRDRDFRMFTLPKGEWMASRPTRESHHEAVPREKGKLEESAIGGGGEARASPSASTKDSAGTGHRG